MKTRGTQTGTESGGEMGSQQTQPDTAVLYGRSLHHGLDTENMGPKVVWRSQIRHWEEMTLALRLKKGETLPVEK